MFAKAAVFFFALVTFVNAAPIIDYQTNPGVRPIKIALPGGERPIQSVGSASLKKEPSLDISTDIDIDLSKRLFEELDFDLNTLIDFVLPHLKRETVDLDSLGSRILGGLKSNGLDQYVEHFATRIQRLKDVLASDASHAQILAEAKNLLLEYNQVLAGSNVNKPVEARGTVVDPQVLSQLQNFVNSVISLLQVTGRSGVVSNLLSEINKLKIEVQNGTLDAGDLLSAARDIVLSVL